MDNSTRDTKPVHVDWRAHCKKVKAIVCCIQKSAAYTREQLSEVALVQRVLATPKPNKTAQHTKESLKASH